MRQIYKDLVIGFILASFVFTPGAFAKPQSTQTKRTSAKTNQPLYLGLEKAIKSNKKGMKISKFVEAATPMVKKREFRDLKKGFMPYWDKKFDKMVVGKDYFVVGFKGQKVFGRFVDRGPIAFIVNGKPLLWKDLMMYGRLKSRLMSIMGIKTKKSRRVSFQDLILEQLFPKAEAWSDEASCEGKGGRFVVPTGSTLGNCICKEGPKQGQSIRPDETCPEAQRPVTPAAPTCKPEQILNESGTECICASGVEWSEEKKCKLESDVVLITPEDEERDRKIGLIAFGAVALLILFLILKKRNKRSSSSDDDDDDSDDDDGSDDLPTPGWTPEPEGQCPTPGARGMTEADLPPECRKTTCADTNSCTDTSSDGLIY